MMTLCWILFPQGVCQLQQSDEDEEEYLHRRIDIRCLTLTLSQRVIVTALKTLTQHSIDSVYRQEASSHMFMEGIKMYDV